MPGMLPVINEECVKQAVRTGLGLKAQINRRSTFDRKNYFYPDLPQGYQISQYKADRRRGRGHRSSWTGRRGPVHRDRHRAPASRTGRRQVAARPAATMTFVDLNRSGVALMEIVSKPDMRSSNEAQAYVTKLRTILRYLGTCDGDMEKGDARRRATSRCAARRRFRHALRDQERQLDPLHRPGHRLRSPPPDRHHRGRRHHRSGDPLYDPNKGETRSMRSKEDAHDYRYFPDPDLLPLEFDEEYVAALKAELPELPDEKKARFISAFGLSAYDAAVLVAERESLSSSRRRSPGLPTKHATASSPPTG
jgi:aspartyl-tRNA(Asn)/glutamyl-tRNA(Gln) amidotransferase subunit B